MSCAVTSEKPWRYTDRECYAPMQVPVEVRVKPVWHWFWAHSARVFAWLYVQNPAPVLQFAHTETNNHRQLVFLKIFKRHVWIMMSLHYPTLRQYNPTSTHFFNQLILSGSVKIYHDIQWHPMAVPWYSVTSLCLYPDIQWHPCACTLIFSDTPVPLFLILTVTPPVRRLRVPRLTASRSTRLGASDVVTVSTPRWTRWNTTRDTILGSQQNHQQKWRRFLMGS